jgi:phosphate transport system protein
VVDELRRSFHDRLSAVHAEVVAMVAAAGAAVSAATSALLEPNPAAAATVAAVPATLAGQNAAVEREVLDLVARQGPVARDLRVLMAALRVAHEAELSGSLAASVATRAGRLDTGVLTPTLRALLYDLGAHAAELLLRSGQAYSTLDDALACQVLGSDGAVRTAHRRFLAELFTLRDAPVEAAVELGVVARCYERITDHAVEIAQRVRFVANAPPLSE